jgi:hypothetical protein
MMYTFKARHQNKIQSILIRKDINSGEFLEALTFALGLPDGLIVGFRDVTGKHLLSLLTHTF